MSKINYFNNNKTRPTDQDILNSKSHQGRTFKRYKDTKSKNGSMDYYKNKSDMLQTNSKQHFETLKFPTFIGKIPGPTLEIEMLTELNLQDVNKWCNRFLTILKHCKVKTENDKMELLAMCIDDRLSSIIKTEDSVKANLDHIMRAAYNSSNYEIYKNSLKGLSVVKCGNMENYFKKFNIALQDVNRCLADGQTMPEEQVYEYFNKGLTNWMKLEVTRLGTRDLNSIVNNLKVQEAQRAQLAEARRTNQSTWTPKTYKKGDNYRNRFYKNKSHANDQSRKKSYESNNTISETSNCDMVVNGKINGIKAMLLIDTGATTSYISSSFIKKHGIQTIKLEDNHAAQIADGRKIPITAQVKSKL